MTKQIRIAELECRRRNYEDRKTKGVIYVHTKGESVFENLEKRHARPHSFYKAVIIPEVVRKLREAGNLHTDSIDLKWSQKAGCSCGCSPGFIVRDGQLNRCDTWVTITDMTTEEEVAYDKKVKDEQAAYKAKRDAEKVAELQSQIKQIQKGAA